MGDRIQNFSEVNICSQLAVVIYKLSSFKRAFAGKRDGRAPWESNCPKRHICEGRNESFPARACVFLSLVDGHSSE